MTRREISKQCPQKQKLKVSIAMVVFLGVAATAFGVTPQISLKPSGLEILVEPPIDPQDAEARWRWIAVKTDPRGDCPELAGWVVGHLFGSFEDPLFDDKIPPGLSPFCVYQHAQPRNDDIDRLLFLVGDQRPLAKVGPDIMGLVPQGPATSSGAVAWNDSWALLRDVFMDHAGQVPEGSFGHGGGAVRLAVVDTQPTDGVGVPGNAPIGFQPSNSPHGFSLLRLAEDLLCRPGCAADVVSYLALFYTCFDPGSEAGCRDPLNGGYTGLFGDLAAAIRAASLDAEAVNAQGLVINLSVGWDPRFGGSQADPHNMPVVVEAVYRAVEDAVCRGAIVVSAAGNLITGPEVSTGPLLPGGWESRLAPGLQACANALGESPDPDHFPDPGTTAYRPLVHSVGGVRANGERLYNTRVDSEPRLAAYADHAVTSAKPGGPEPTVQLTGSSVSALVVAATVAAVISYRPDLKPFDAVQTSYEAGDLLAREASWCWDDGGGCRDEVRRISMCAAVELACSTGLCLEGGPVSECPAWPGETLQASDIDFSIFELEPEVDIASLDQFLRDPECGQQVVHYQTGDIIENPCPHRQYHDLLAEPWLNPQPCSQPCPPCTLSFSSTSSSSTSSMLIGAEPSDSVAGLGTLHLEIAEDFRDTLEDVVLNCGKNSYRLALASGLSAGDRAQVLNVPADCGSENRALLTFTVRDAFGEVRSVASPLLVLD